MIPESRSTNHDLAEHVGRHDPWDPLQSRTAPDLHWTTANVGEAMPGVQTPLGWTFWGELLDPCPREGAYRIGAISKAERHLGARDEDRIIRVFYGRTAMQVEFLAMLGDRVPGTTGPATVQSLFGRPPDDMVFRPTRRRYPIIAVRMPATYLGAPRRLRRLAAEHDAYYRAHIDGIDTLSRERAIELLREARARLADAVLLHTVGVLGVVQPSFDFVKRLVEFVGVGDVNILTGVSGGPEMEFIEALWDASRGRVGIEQVAAEYGFHGPLEGELSSSVWREDPEPLRKIVAGYAAMPDTADPRVTAREHTMRRPLATKEFLAATPIWLRPIARVLLRLSASRLPMRGLTKRSFLQTFDICRATARHLGTLLVRDGVLIDPDDVFYLTYDELTGAIPDDARDQVTRRRARHSAYRELRLPGEWVGFPAAEIAASERAEADAITGVGVSSGVAEGLARVVLDPDFDDVEPGEVLVAPFTDPSWASIMFTSAALVVDIGGALSHAAVVARELGLPCVVNTRIGTRAIRTGDRLRVDGASGVVAILARADDTAKR